MKTILAFPRRADEVPRLLSDRAQTQGWNIQLASYTAENRDAIRFLDFWKPDGCIVNNDRLDARLFRNIPTVFAHRNVKRTSPNGLWVSFDERKVARLAVQELLPFHCKTHVFVPEGTGAYWETERQISFEHALRENFQKTCAFTPPHCPPRHHRFQASLSRYLQGLPRPLGIFAASDFVAETVLNVCRRLGIEVPRDAVVVSTDNNVNLCEALTPTLTSIAFDYTKFDDAYITPLAQLMASGRPPRERKFLIPPSGIVRRASTRILLKSDSRVDAALDLIRLKGGEGLTAREVAASFPCSRRMAELRFRAATGHSFLEEILAVRRRKAEQLRAKGLKDEAVAQICGYSARSSLHRLLTAVKDT